MYFFFTCSHRYTSPFWWQSTKHYQKNHIANFTCFLLRLIEKDLCVKTYIVVEIKMEKDVANFIVLIFMNSTYFIFSSIYPFVASAKKHSSWVPMLLLVSDPNDTVTSNSFDVPVGCVMFDIVIIIGDVILNLVTLKQNHTKHLKKISISKYWFCDLWHPTFN